MLRGTVIDALSPRVPVLPVMIRSSLAPFNCVATNGVPTMVAEPSIQCTYSYPVHLPMAIVGGVSLALYGAGIPVVFGWLLFTNHDAIVADQLLRQRGEGDSVLTNPHIRVRRRLRKLYEDFRPDCCWS